MPTSGVKNYSPQIHELTEEAWEYLGISPHDLESQSNISVRRSMNLVIADWMNDFVPQWMKQEVNFQMEEERETYDANYTDANGNRAIPDGLNNITSLVIADSYGEVNYYMIRAITAEQWNDHPNRTTNQSGQPHSYWFQRSISPKLHFIYKPGQPYYCRYMGVFSPDTVLNSFDELEVPPRYLNAFVLALAVKLAPKIKGPQFQEVMAKLPLLMQLSMQAYNAAKAQERDDVDLTVTNWVFKGMGGA